MEYVIYPIFAVLVVLTWYNMYKYVKLWIQEHRKENNK